MIAQLAEQYDLVLVDTPPVLAVTDPMVLAPRMDGVVVDAAHTSLDSLRRTREALGRASANVLGLNKLTAKSGSYYYSHYRSSYGTETTDPAAANGSGALEVPSGAGRG